MKVNQMVRAFDRNRMKITQPKADLPFAKIEGVTVTTLREKNKILGWRVNAKVFMVGRGTILQAWIKTETYINKLLKKK